MLIRKISSAQQPQSISLACLAYTAFSVERVQHCAHGETTGDHNHQTDVAAHTHHPTAPYRQHWLSRGV